MKIIIEADLEEAQKLISVVGAEVTIQLKKQFKHTDTFFAKQKERKHAKSPLHKHNISSAMKKHFEQKRSEQGVQTLFQEPKQMNRWSKEEVAKLKSFWNEPSNHYRTGETIGDKLKPFAKSMNRSPMAISLQVIARRLNKKKVYGDVPKPSHSKSLLGKKVAPESFPDRKPKIMPPRKNTHRRTRTHGFRASRWSKEQEQMVKDWYFTPENHYSNGMLVQSHLSCFAKAIGRTPKAVHVRAIELGFNKKFVQGSLNHASQSHERSSDQKEAKHEKYMARRKAVVPVSRMPGTITSAPQFPEFSSVLLDKKLLVALFNQLVHSKKSLKFKDAIAYNIDSYDQWVNFVYEALKYSKAIANFLQVKGNFTLGKEGSDVYISYVG